MNEEMKSTIYSVLVAALVKQGLQKTWNSIQAAKNIRIQQVIKPSLFDLAHGIALLSLPIFAYQLAFGGGSVMIAITVMIAFFFSLWSIIKNRLVITSAELINTAYQEQVLFDLYRASQVTPKMTENLANQGIDVTEEVFQKSFIEVNFAITKEIEQVITNNHD